MRQEADAVAGLIIKTDVHGDSMAPKLYRVGEDTYVVGDDYFIQRDGSDGSWVSSEALTEDDLLDLISGVSELDDFDLDEESALPWDEFVEVPPHKWQEILEAM